MKILITGGTGLVGREVAKSLAKDGHAVTILSRHRTASPFFEGSDGIQLEQWDGKSADALLPFVGSFEVIIHLAGENISARRWTKSQKQLLIESRIHSGKCIAMAIEKVSQKPRLLIQASAIGYYGNRDQEEVHENSGPGKGFLAQEVCLPWEASSAGVEALGVRRILLRTGIVLSNRGGALPKMKLPFAYFLAGPLGTGNQWMSWIHIKDMVRAIRFLMETEGASGPFNLTAPHALPNKSFMKTLGRVLWRPSFLPVPSFALKLLFGDMSSVILEGQHVAPRRLLELGFRFEFPELEGALKDLLLPPKDY